MSEEQARSILPCPLRVGRRYLVWGCCCGLLCALGLIYGCTRQPPRHEETTKTTASDETLASVCAPLRKAADFDTLRNAVEQINAYLTKHPDQKPPTLTSSEKQLLTDTYFLDAGELAEVSSSSYTILDAHHLDLYLLLHDAVHALKMEQLKPLERAAAGFDWVIQQVTLLDREEQIERPPHFVLRRGWGNMLERAQVFLAVLDALGLDGCMLLVPPAPKGQQGPLDYWLVGVLIDRDIYLFDTRLGLPLPGPKGKGIATLAQVKAQPELIKSLAAHPKLPYDVTPEQAAAAEIHVACALSTLAPRMRYLQEVLSTNSKVYLGKDPATLLPRFETAAGGNHVQIWNTPGDLRTPIRVLRSFVPPEEGGSDTSKPSRRDEAQRELVPVSYFPKLGELPQAVKLQLLSVYAAPFINMPLKARVPHDQLAGWLPGLVDTRAKMNEVQENKIPDILLRERMPRDLLLHGRLEEATVFLVALREELTRQREQRKDAEFQKHVQRWCEEANRIHGNLEAAQAGVGGRPADPIAVAKAQEDVKKLWDMSAPVTGEVLGAAAEPLLGEVICLLALAKLEEAEQLQARVDRTSSKPMAPEAVRDAWSEAARWPETYLDEYPSGMRLATTIRLRARALQALDRRGEAAALLEKYAAVPGREQAKAQRLEKLGFLLWAQHLKGF